MNPTLHVADRRTTLQVRPGSALTVTQRSTTLQVTQGGQTLELPIRRTTVEIRAPLQLDVPVRRTVLEFRSPGVQGPPGPAQIYLQDSDPAPIAGYVLAHFKTGQFPGYPNDVTLKLVTP